MHLVVAAIQYTLHAPDVEWHTDNLLVIKPYEDEHVDDCLYATLLEVHTYINEYMHQRVYVEWH